MYIVRMSDHTDVQLTMGMGKMPLQPVLLALIVSNATSYTDLAFFKFIRFYHTTLSVALR